MIRIKILYVNWRQVGSVNDYNGCGEDYTKYEVGIKGVTRIREISPDNQPVNFLVTVETGGEVQMYRVFNPNHIEYFPEKKCN